MQQEVRLDLVTYDALQHSIQSKTERIDALERELAKVKEDHEAEIEKLTKQGKVRVVEVPYSVMQMLICEPKKEYKGFDDVKAEVEEHFKKGLFEEEWKKFKEENLKEQQETIAKADETISRLRSEIARLENRTLIQRICNK